MINGDPKEPIDYRFLNVIERKFYPDQSKLSESLKYVDGAKLISIPNECCNQILIAGGKSDMSQCLAIITCKRLTGMYK